MTGKKDANHPVKLFRTEKAWADWLAKNGEKAPGIWMKIAKKSAELKSISHPEALDIALCYGWIDGLRKSNDDESFLQKFTPRTKKSFWSRINRDKVLALIESGRMQAAGLAEIERAKEDGRWDAAYDSARTSQVPEDLEAAFRTNPKAGAFFETLNAQNRYAVLFRIQTATKPETRKKRIEAFVEMLSRNEKFYP
jgi:uncharacterized protein YdeI (YjbR/CyaY-like superfamily)